MKTISNRDDLIHVDELRKYVSWLDDGEDDAAAEFYESLDHSAGVLINEHYFDEYIKQSYAESGEIPDWLFAHIDWKSFVRDMSMDYTSGEFDDVTFYYLA